MIDDRGQIESHLLDRLARLGRTLRRRLLIYGCCAVGSGGVGAILAIIVVDWLLWLPPVLRVAVGALFLIGLALASLHWLVRPLRAKFDAAEIAGRLESHFTKLDDRLSSSVDFLQRPGDDFDALRRRVINDTEALLRNLPLQECLTLRPLVKVVALFAFSAALLGVVASVDPAWSRMAVSRYLAPFSGLTWPHRVEIYALTRDQKVAFGESTTVRMQVVRGASATLRGVVRLRGHGGEATTLAMNRHGTDLYACQIDNLTETLRYWFEAGDDATADQPGTIHVFHRPGIVSVAARLHPPPYASELPVEELDLSGGLVRVVRRSLLELDIRSSKAILQRQGAAVAQLLLADATAVPLDFSGPDATRLSARLAIDHDAEFSIVLTSEDGFTGGDTQTYRIVATEDRPPTAVIREPRATLEVTPTAVVRVAVEAADDLGIRAMSIIAERSGREGAARVPLNRELVADRDESGRAVASAEMTWNLAEYDAQPGETILYRAAVTDNYGAPEHEGNTAHSQPMRLLVVSTATFQHHRREELVLLGDRLRQALVDQEVLGAETEALLKAGSNGSWSAPDQATIARLAFNQTRLAEVLEDASGRLRWIVLQMEANSVGDDGAATHTQEIAAALDEIAGGPMGKATRELDAARAVGAHAAERIAAATLEQRAAASALSRAITSMGRWGDVDEMLSKARGLLDRQQSLRADVFRQGQQTLGGSTETLSRQDQAALLRSARLQDLLADDTAELLDVLRNLASQPHIEGVATADDLDDALRVAVAAEIVGNMREAADAIATNRMAAAQMTQRLAEAGLWDMLSALQRRRLRELEELAKDLEQAEQTLADLLAQQRELLSATQEVQRLQSNADALLDLGPRQFMVERNTERLAEDWSRSDDLFRVGAMLDRCAEPMGLAVASLTDADAAASVAQEQRAVDLLEETQAELTAILAEVRDRAEKQKLTAVRDALETIRGRQQEINEGTVELVAVQQSRGTLGRAGIRRASALARRQDELVDAAGALRAEMGQAVVYDFVLGRIRGWMTESAEALALRRIDDALAGSQQRILADIDLLITAINDLLDLPSPDEFAREGGGASSGRVTADATAIPTLAELLVLKAMQASLNLRTVEAARDHRPTEATEAQLLGIRVLAEEQEQIEALAAKVIERMDGHGP